MIRCQYNGTNKKIYPVGAVRYRSHFTELSGPPRKNHNSTRTSIRNRLKLFTNPSLETRIVTKHVAVNSS